MQNCLEYICREFEKVKDYLHKPSPTKELIINNLFENFMHCFSDIGMRYLLLSDFYDYVKLMHLYPKA
jgi:hypothetical protein